MEDTKLIVVEVATDSLVYSYNHMVGEGVEQFKLKSLQREVSRLSSNFL